MRGRLIESALEDLLGASTEQSTDSDADFVDMFKLKHSPIPILCPPSCPVNSNGPSKESKLTMEPLGLLLLLHEQGGQSHAN